MRKQLIRTADFSVGNWKREIPETGIGIKCAIIVKKYRKKAQVYKKKDYELPL
jgi:hypothetical protein